MGTSRKFKDLITYLRNDPVKSFLTPKQSISDEDKTLIEDIVLAADSRKAIGISVFNLQGISDVSDFMIVMEGNSKPQTLAIITAIEVRASSIPQYRV